MAPTDLQLLPIVAGPRGNKSAALLRGNAPVTAKLPATTTPFNAGVFNPDPNAPSPTRLNLDLHCDAEAYQTFLREIDSFVLQTLQADPQSWFKKKMTPDEVKAVFKPSITERSKDLINYLPTVRTKFNVSGLRVWTPEKTLRSLPENWKACEIQPILQAKSVWFMAQGGCGVTYELLDACVVERGEECPF